MKAYEKPILQFIEIRLEERIAGGSNCAASQGSIHSHGNPCVPGAAWSATNPAP